MTGSSEEYRQQDCRVVNALEDVLPVKDVCRKLAETEIEEMDEQSLTRAQGYSARG